MAPTVLFFTDNFVDWELSPDFAYVGRFVFLPDTKGRLQYDIWTPIDDCCSKFVLFNGWSSQWPKLRAEGDGMSCHEKLDLIPNIQNTKIPLKEGVNRCYRETDANNVEWLHCTSTQRRFLNTRPQWYYLAFMNCHYQRNTGINVTYKIHLTNNGFEDGLNIEFSADEDSNLLVTSFCGIILCFFMTCGCIFGVKLRARKMLHVTYRMWFISLTLHTTGVIIMAVGWYQFALDGYDRENTEAVGHYFTSAGTICYAVLVVLMSKGYTITRLRMRSLGIVKIFLFAIWFSAGYFILYYIQGKADTQDVTNIYDTPATVGITCLRLGATAWCLYGTFFTVKNYPAKTTFYFTFTLVTTFWFLSEPVMIFLSSYALPLYCRAKWIHAVYLFTIVYGHLVFLLLTRPSEANTYFPYHLSTNKVDAFYDPESNSLDWYKPTEETFTNFFAIHEVAQEDTLDDELPKKKKAPVMKFTGKGKPNGGFNIFLAVSRQHHQEEEPLDQPPKPLPTVSASVSMTTMLNTPVQPPQDILMQNDLDLTIDEYENDTWKETAVDTLKKNNLKQDSVWAEKTTTSPVQQITYTPVTFLKPEDTALSASVSDDGGTWQNLVFKHLDEPEDHEKASPATTFSKCDARPVTPPKNMPVAHRMASPATTSSKYDARPVSPPKNLPVANRMGSDSVEAASDKDANKPTVMERGRTKERRRKREQRKNREPTIDSVLDPTIDSVLDSISVSQRCKENKQQPRTLYRKESEVEQAPVLPQNAGTHRRQHKITEEREGGQFEEQPVVARESGKGTEQERIERRQKHRSSTEYREENEQQHTPDEERAREERRRRRRLRKMRTAAQVNKEKTERHQIDAHGEVAASEDVTRRASRKYTQKARLTRGMDDGTIVVELA